MKQEIKLYHYWRSSCSYRVRLALAHKQIAYTQVPVNLLKGEHKSQEFLELNPSAQVPALQVNGKTLADSVAILEWLEQQFPEKPLLPQDPWERAQVRDLMHCITAGIQPIQNLKVITYMAQLTPDEDLQKLKAHHAHHWIKAGFEALEPRLRKTSGSYCFGNEPSLADLCLLAQLYNAHRFALDLTDFPVIARIESHLKLLPCYMEACPEAFEPQT